MSDDRITIPGTLRGYRSWGVGRDSRPSSKGWVLWPLNVTDLGPWHDGENVAGCPAIQGEWVFERESGPAPHPNGSPERECRCGIYAMYKPEIQWPTHPRWVNGVIEAYGRIVLGQHGFRAEKAKILAITLSPGASEYGLAKTYPQVRFFQHPAEMMKAFPPPKDARNLFGPEVAKEWPMQGWLGTNHHWPYGLLPPVLTPPISVDMEKIRAHWDAIVKANSSHIITINGVEFQMDWEKSDEVNG